MAGGVVEIKKKIREERKKAKSKPIWFFCGKVY